MNLLPIQSKILLLTKKNNFIYKFQRQRLCFVHKSNIKNIQGLKIINITKKCTLKRGRMFPFEKMERILNAIYLNLKDEKKFKAIDIFIQVVNQDTFINVKIFQKNL